MKINQFLVIFLLLCSKILNAQWTENFNSSAWKSTWRGDTTFFQVNAAMQLQTMQNTTGATIALARHSEAGLNTEWTFVTKLNFKLATNNLLRAYIISNQFDLKSPLQGYFFEVSGTGTTYKYSIKKQNGTRISNLIESESMATPASIAINVKITLDAVGNWRLGVGDVSSSYLTDYGSAKDTQFTSLSAFFGFFCRYTTSARSHQFYFDDIKVYPLVRDTIPPTLKKAEFIQPHQMRLLFSEKMDSTSLKILTHYMLNDEHPSAVVIDAEDTIRLQFSKPFATGDYQLKLQNLMDRSQNSIQPMVQSFFYIEPYQAKIGDVIINEVMAKPDSSTQLPNFEYFELWNRSDKYIILKDWFWADKTRKVTFSADTLKPNSYAIVCHSNHKEFFEAYGKVVSLSSFPSLNNDTDRLILYNEKGEVVDSVTYSDDWYDDLKKKNGGFSLEWSGTLCSNGLSWMASNDISGGTPGRSNSVFGWKKKPLKILNFQVVSDTSVLVVWNQRIDLSLLNLSVQYQNYQFHKSEQYLDTAFQVVFSSLKPFRRGEKQVLLIEGVSNCDTLIQSMEFPFFIAYQPMTQEILISEIMIYPRMGGASYIELYNPSLKTFNLKDMVIANQNTEGKPSGMRVLSTVDRWFNPGEYLVLTTDSLNIKENYMVLHPQFLHQMRTLPQFSLDMGTIWLMNLEGITIDKLDYTREMHLQALKDLHGVALERISFEKEANTIGNFVSVAADVGFGTPSYKGNLGANDLTKPNFWLGNKIVSPDGDGFEDVLEINYELDATDWMAEMKLYDVYGNYIQSIYPHQSISKYGRWLWNPSGQLSTQWKQGIYVVWIQLYNLRGKKHVLKLPFAMVLKR